jgi:hypothetical protein
MFETIIGLEDLGEMSPTSILGVLIGLCINDVDLVRTSLINVINNVEKDDVKALLAIISKDPTQETSLKLLFKKLKINPKLGLNLLELVSIGGNGELKFNAALSICKNQCGNPTLVAAMIALMKRDVSNVRIISEALNLDYENTALIVACGNENFELIKNKLKFLSDELQIMNVDALKNIISLSLGNIEPLREIVKQNPTFLTNKQFKLLLALLNIANQGFWRRRYKKTISFNKIFASVKAIATRLMEVFEIDTKNKKSNINVSPPIEPMYDEEEKVNTIGENYEGGNNLEEHKSIDKSEELKSYGSSKACLTKENNSNTDRSENENTSDKLLQYINWLVLMGMNDNASIGKIGEKMIKVIESKY